MKRKINRPSSSPHLERIATACTTVFCVGVLVWLSFFHQETRHHIRTIELAKSFDDDLAQIKYQDEKIYQLGMRAIADRDYWRARALADEENQFLPGSRCVQPERVSRLTAPADAKAASLINLQGSVSGTRALTSRGLPNKMNKAVPSPAFTFLTLSSGVEGHAGSSNVNKPVRGSCVETATAKADVSGTTHSRYQSRPAQSPLNPGHGNYAEGEEMWDRGGN